MNEKEIYSMFNELGITSDKMPEYKDPETFAQGYKKCSILKDTPIVYSTSTQIQTIDKSER